VAVGDAVLLADCCELEPAGAAPALFFPDDEAPHPASIVTARAVPAMVDIRIARTALLFRIVGGCAQILVV